MKDTKSSIQEAQENKLRKPTWAHHNKTINYQRQKENPTSREGKIKITYTEITKELKDF